MPGVNPPPWNGYLPPGLSRDVADVALVVVIGSVIVPNIDFVTCVVGSAIPVVVLVLVINNLSLGWRG